MPKNKVENLVDQKARLEKNALTVLQRRYLKKNEKGDIVETPEELFLRVAVNIAQADVNYDKDADITATIKEFYNMMANLDFLPNSPTLMNAGRHLQQLAACFVLPIEDSMESIFQTLKDTALIHKSGGGTGFSFSRLRPNKDIVKSTCGVSSGPVSFMQVFNAATEAIKQGGTRRGANMGMLRVDHPDILDFISAKNKSDSLNNFNISIAITEEFMKALENKIDYNLYNPRDKKVFGTLNAKIVFDKIVEQAWKNGEPGIVFIDSMNDQNPTPKIGEIESTNPCGEQPLLPYEACNLGSINLGHFIKDKDLDWARLEKTIKSAVHFLDNVIDMNNYPIDKIGENTRANRKIGLGIMGWADMLLILEIAYGSQESIALAEKVMKFLQDKSHEFSRDIAARRGAFPNFTSSIYASGKPIRNATTTTIAPTGTIGIIASASGGIEPIFALVYKRSQCLDNEEMFEVNPYFEKLAKEKGFYSKELMDKIAQKGSVQGLSEIPEDVRKVFVTSHDISPENHVRMQAAFQKFTDNAVSKTVNFPHSATKEDVKTVYILSYKMGCKGVTVYRDGSRDSQVLNILKIEQPQQAKEVKTKTRVRSNRTAGFTFRMHTGCGKMYVTINEDDDGVCEVFTQLGKSGGCTSSQSEAISRLISLALRSGVDQGAIIKQIKGIRCPSPTLAEGGVILSCADAVAKALEAYNKGKNSPDLFVQKKINTLSSKEKKCSNNHSMNMSGDCPQCPECGEMLSFAEGCAVCRECGYSKCS